MALRVGDEAPDFDLPSSPTGDRFKLSDHRGRNAVIVNFTPAAFSPICSNQLPQIERLRSQFQAQDAVPIVITNDGAWAQKAWKEELGISFPVLSDFFPQGAVARSYGVLIEARGIANRAVFVVGKDGRIAYAHVPATPADLPDYDPVLACTKD